MKFFPTVEKKSREEKKLFICSAVFALLLLAADQWSKWFFIINFKEGESVPLIRGFLNFTSVRNYGAAWSIFSGYGWGLFAFGVLAIVVIFFYFRWLAEGFSERYIALLMVVSGIFGNSFDRAFHGAVVDFIHVHYFDRWHYPIFNVADMAICVGVGIFMLSGFFRKSGNKEAEKC